MNKVSAITCNVLAAGLALLPYQSAAQQIKANQIGYTTHSAKYATVPETDATEFTVRDYLSGQTVYTAPLPAASYDSNSGEKVSNADFSAFDTEGKYYIQTGLMKSYPFEIKRTGIYTALAKSSIKGFYYWRASQAIDSAYAQEGKNNFARPMGHPDSRCLIHTSAADAIRKAGDVFAAPGGWYDAGDYNKYVVNAAPPVFSLLHAYELNPTYYSLLDLNIPESINDIPDILDEAKYETDWLLCMQDPNDGGVYHKLTSKSFCGTIMPDADKSERYFVQKSTAAALDFAAIMAKSYRVFNNFPELKNYADKCLSAAKSAFAWAEKNPDLRYSNPADIRTGEYGDNGLSDELFYACAEMFIATGDKKYWDKLNLSQQFEIPSWNRVETFGLLSLASRLDNIEIPQDKKDIIRKQVVAMGETYYSQAMVNKYRNTGTDFFWGGNGGIAGKGMVAYCAYRIGGGEKLLTVAEMSLNYLLGQNALGHSFVTGFGSKYTRDPHDRRSSADGIAEPIPGYVSGGANARPAADCNSGTYTSTYPAKKYSDKYCSYSTNEIAINWNGPLAFIAGAVDAATANLRLQPSFIETNENGSGILIHFTSDILISDHSVQPFVLKNGNTILKIDSLTQNEKSVLIVHTADTAKPDMTELWMSYSGTQITDLKGRYTAQFDSISITNKCTGGPAYLLSASTSADGTSVNLTFSKKVRFQSFSSENISILSSGKEIFDSIQSKQDSTVIGIATNRLYRDNIVTISINTGAEATDGGAVVPVQFIRAANIALPFPPVPVVGETEPKGTGIKLVFDKAMKQLPVTNEIMVTVKNSNGTNKFRSAKQIVSRQYMTVELPVKLKPSDEISITYINGGIASEYDEAIPIFTDFPIKNTLSVIVPYIIDSVSTTIIQAEQCAYNNYVTTKSCTDTDGGLYAYLSDTDEWTEYPVDVVSAGTYMMQLRVATTSYENTVLAQTLTDNTLADLQNFDFSATGGEQKWITRTAYISLSQGKQSVRIFSANGLVNLNWIKIGKQLDVAVPASESGTGTLLYPNPAKNMRTSYAGNSEAMYRIHTADGSCVAIGTIIPGESLSYPRHGVYIISLSSSGATTIEQIIVE